MTPSAPATKSTKNIGYMCSHTHWDREWYGTFQEFRMKLLRLVDRLMDSLDRDPEFRCFNLDGQTVVLEDYLEVRPEQRPRLERFIREGRIYIGPWYILPDEWLVSGESTVRNMLRGRRLCREFGVEQPNAGYLPDMFGHISQMPQLLRRFGFDNAIMWRGLSGDEYMSELWWESPDGSRVFTVHLPEYCGYCNAAFFYHSLPEEARTLPPETPAWSMVNDNIEFCAGALKHVADRLRAKSRTNHLLFMNGVDHMEAQSTTPAIIRRANEMHADLELRHATFLEFMDAVKTAAPQDLQVIRGEQRSTAVAAGSGEIVLPNIMSSRVYLKISNARCQHLLERWAEPFMSAAAWLGAPYDEGLVNTGWKWLLRNHPHDSIGGCSADPIHRQMETRFEWAGEIAEILTGGSLQAIAAQVDTSALAPGEAAFLLFNPHDWPVTDLVGVTLDLSIEEGWFARNSIELNLSNPYMTLRNIEITEWNGTPVDFHIRDMKFLTVHKPWMEAFGAHYQVFRFWLGLRAANLPAMGYKAYRIAKAEKRNRLPNRAPAATAARMSNEHLTAEFEPNGTLILSGQATGGAVLRGMHYFEDNGDNGDGYTYSPPRVDETATSLGGPARISLVADSPAEQAVAVDYELLIPEGLEGDRQHRSDSRVPLKIRSVFRLGADSRRVDVETTLVNPARDHRLRVCFALQEAGPVHHAEMQFDVVERKTRVIQPPANIWIEDMPVEQPVHGFVSAGRLAVAGVGLHEYEISEDPAPVLRLTLLRAVNYLGAGPHLNTIQYGAGPMMETPDQQVLGRKFTFHYTIMAHPGDWAAAGIPRQAAHHNTMWHGVTVSQHDGPLPQGEASLLRVDTPGIMLSALKQVEGEPGHYVARFWSSNRDATATRITFHTPPAEAWRSNLAEDKLEGLPVEAATVRLEIGPAEIQTFRFRY